MELLSQAEWLSPRTRAVHLAFTAYNGNVDYWTTSWFIVEMPPGGYFLPVTNVDVFKPVTLEYSLYKNVLFFDLVRMALILYVGVYQVYFEISIERKRKRRAKDYLCSGIGLADICIVLTFLFIFTLRFLFLGEVFNA